MELYGQTKLAADALHANAREIHELTERLEALTKDTLAWYIGTKAKVEAVEAHIAPYNPLVERGEMENPAVGAGGSTNT